MPLDNEDKEIRSLLNECIEESQEFFFKNKKFEVYKYIMEIVEKPLIESALKRTDGNQRKAAKILGINRNTLHTKIRKLNIKVDDFKVNY